MSDSKPTYQELQAKIDQLQSENKQLRLRPAIHSTDARLLDFMKIKSRLANAMLSANDIQHGIRISVQYLSKINNIHGLGFFKYDKEENFFEILQESKLPKKLLHQLKKADRDSEFIKKFFQGNNTFYTNSEDSKNQDPIILEHTIPYLTVLILPIIEDINVQYTLLLISKKAFKNNRLFKIVYENIQIQLKSSYSRLLAYEKLSNNITTNDSQAHENGNNYENINKELLRQLKVYRDQNLHISKELSLYKSIINQQKDIILRINREGQILYQNPAFEQIRVFKEGDANQLFNYLGDGDFPGIEQILHDFEEGMQQVNCEIQLKYEHPKWFNFFFAPIKNKRGLIMEVQIVARNIDKIIRLEQKLELQKEMLVNMLNESDYLGFAIDKSGYISMVTENLKIKTGLDEHQFIHKTLQDLVDIKCQKEIENFLDSSSNISSLKTKISFANSNMDIRQFELELNPLNCMSVNNRYFIGNLSPAK